MTMSSPTAAWAGSIRRTETRAKRWQFPQTDRAPSAALALALDFPEPLAAILNNRGITEADAARSFLNPRLSGLHDPLLLRDMDRAVERLGAAIRGGEKIEIHGDYDVDGTTSTVI